MLILHGSPRSKGNSSFLLNAAKESLQNKYEIEDIVLNNMKQTPCVHCDYCKNHDNVCVNMLMDKVFHADAIIIATPDYWWGVTAQLKMFLDKFYSKDELFQKQSKKVGLIIVGAATLEDPQYSIITKQFECICNYLSWDYAFNFNASAYEAGEVADKTEILNELTASLNSSF